MAEVFTQTIGYPRIGKNREIKRAVEAFWKGSLDQGGLLQTHRLVEEQGWETQLAAGIDRIGVGDATLYDHVLDWAVRFGLIAERFQHLQGMERYFGMARGIPGIPALELTKWFDTNYHYLVPEIEPGLSPQANFSNFLETIQRGMHVLGERAVPVVVGPITLLQLSNIKAPFDIILEKLLPLYEDLLRKLKALGTVEVQLHEPALVLGNQEDQKQRYQNAYASLAETDLPINLVTYFDDLGEAYNWIVELPVAVISLDFTRGDNLALVTTHGWPEGKTLAAGSVDGRNIWQTHMREKLAFLQKLSSLAPVRIGPSCSLQFVPYQASREAGLPEALRGVLAFAEEKLNEIRLLARMLSGTENQVALQASDNAWERFRAFAPGDPGVHEKMRSLTPVDFQRRQSYEQRRPQQVQLPLFPTTTIGSFPQTAEVRRLRARFKRDEIGQAEYLSGIDAWIRHTIQLQEQLGIDVLVHGEFERSDMVEYFAEKMQGFAFTEHGWVQSYGNRYVRPPIIYTDIARTESMSVREFKVAQSSTERPVKGMLTGPVTILNWSFPRTDISRKEIAFQIALALRDEIRDLEEAGGRVIQVDEPALREGLPLKSERRADYLSWAVNAFRLATGCANPATQIHTHMCYSEFGDIMEAIDRLDADVISIENARSDDETLRELAESGYRREVGPGVYDVHSSVTPQVEQISAKLRTFLQHLQAEQIWVNPDCGLKTRAWDEVTVSLENIVSAVQKLRERVQSK